MPRKIRLYKCVLAILLGAGVGVRAEEIAGEESPLYSKTVESVIRQLDKTEDYDRGRGQTAQASLARSESAEINTAALREFIHRDWTLQRAKTATNCTVYVYWDAKAGKLDKMVYQVTKAAPSATIRAGSDAFYIYWCEACKKFHQSPINGKRNIENGVELCTADDNRYVLWCQKCKAFHVTVWGFESKTNAVSSAVKLSEPLDVETKIHESTNIIPLTPRAVMPIPAAARQLNSPAHNTEQ